MKLRPSVDFAGQPYVDEPVHVNPKPISVIERAVAVAFKRRLPKPILVSYNHVKLRWMKPDGKGRLVPR